MTDPPTEPPAVGQSGVIEQTALEVPLAPAPADPGAQHLISQDSVPGPDANTGYVQNLLTRDPQPGHHAQRRDPRARPEREAADGHLAGSAHAEPTHSSDPSEKNWCFHTGSRALMASTSVAQVSNAAARWSAATAATSAASPTLQRPDPVAGRDGAHAAGLVGDVGQHLGERVLGADGCAEYSRRTTERPPS